MSTGRLLINAFMLVFVHDLAYCPCVFMYECLFTFVFVRR